MTSTDPPGVEPTSGSADVGNARADASTMTETMGTASSLPSSSDDPSQMDSGAAEESNADVPSNKKQDEAETATDATMESEKPSDEAQNNGIQVVVAPSSGIIISSSKKSRPPYKYDPEKITLRFLFANRDGLTVTVECKPSDTVGEVKGALISVWPKDMPCDSGDNLRLICMGKGFLSPDTRTLADCQVPVFKTHPTPINVSVKPSEKPKPVEIKKKANGASHNATSGGSGAASSSSSAHHASGSGPGRTSSSAASGTSANATETGQGCGCVIQ